MNKKKALITGITGQDGSYLSEFLLSKNYEVIGTSRKNNSSNYWRLEKLNIKNHIKIYNHKKLNSLNALNFIEKERPSEIYNLSGMSSVSQSFKCPISTFRANTIDCLQILNSIFLSKKSIKFYQASSSEMYGNTNKKNNERTKFNPLSPYAISKMSAHQITINYRNNYKIFASNGILYNHESPLRDENFISKKIIRNLIKYKKGLINSFEVGNINARRDWGHARDFVKAMYLIMQHKLPDDFVITSEKNYSIIELINIVCVILNIKCKWKGDGLNQVLIDREKDNKIIKINPKYFRPLDIDFSSGDSEKARKLLKWKCKTTFKKLINEMILYELEI